MRSFTLATAFMVFVVGVARADQPKMREALQELRAARQELEKADDHKGGHKARALTNIDNAIAQIQQGIEAADKDH